MSSKASVELLGREVCMVMAYTEDNPRVAGMGSYAAMMNMEYCRRHGYGFRLYKEGFDKSRHPAWSKLLFVKETLKDYKWVMWMDADAVVTNPNVELGRFIDDKFMFVVCRQKYPLDGNGANTGVFFIKSGKDADEFLDAVWSYWNRKGRDDSMWDQSGFRYVMDVTPLKSKIKVLSRRNFNSLVYHDSIGGRKEDYNSEEELWRKGDFVAHFGGKRDDGPEAMRSALRESGSGVLISAVMSTYSRNKPDKSCPNMLRRALDSVLAQTFQDWELILLDDGSKDGTEAVCKEYAARDSRIRHVRFEENSGCPARRYNDGMKMASGLYFMFMFDDDFWYPDAMACLYEAQTRKFQGCGMTYGLVDMVDTRTGGKNPGFGLPWDMKVILERNIMGNLSVIVPRTTIDVLGGYDEDPKFKQKCDWDLWVRIGKRFQVGRIEKTVGCVMAAQPDAVGLTVPSEDYAALRKIQETPGRHVRLQGELGCYKKIKSMVFVMYGHDPMQRRWCIDYLSEAVRKTGIETKVVDVESEGAEKVCEDVDVVLVYKCFQTVVLDMMRRLRAKGVFVVFMVDDYLFQPGCKYTNGGLPLTPLKEADAVLSPSSLLLSKVPLDKPKILRRNVLDETVMRMLRQKYRRNRDVFSVALTMSPGPGRDIDGFIDKMLGVLDMGVRYGEKLVVHYFGKKVVGKYGRIRVEEHPAFERGDWKGFYEKIVELDLGAIVNPLDEVNEYWSCKSDLKYVESGAMGVPLVTSRVRPFAEFMKEGENGFFASTPGEFAEKVLKIMRDEELSRKVSERAFEYVTENCDVAKNAAKFLDDLEEARQKVAGRYVEPVVAKVPRVVVEDVAKPRLRSRQKHDVVLESSTGMLSNESLLGSPMSWWSGGRRG